MDPKSDAMPVNTLEKDVQLKEGKGVEVSEMENKVSDVLMHKVSAGKDPMNRFTDSAVRSTDNANGWTRAAGNESARSKLRKICSASGWKEPLYDFKEEGPAHNKSFTCKVTVHVEGISDTVLESFGDPKGKKIDAQEHAAQGALWCLAHYGHVK